MNMCVCAKSDTQVYTEHLINTITSTNFPCTTGSFALLKAPFHNCLPT